MPITTGSEPKKEDYKKFGSELKRAFSIDNDVLQYMMNNTPGDALMQLVEMAKGPKLKNKPAAVTKAEKQVAKANAAVKKDMLGTGPRTPASKPRGADPLGLMKPKKKKPQTSGPSTRGSNKPKSKPEAKKAAPKAKPNSKPAASGKVSFGTAFANARKAGLKTFTWNGKKYTTQTKAEAAKKTPATPKPRPKKQAPKSSGTSALGAASAKAGQKKKTAAKKAAPKRTPMSTVAKAPKKSGLPAGVLRKFNGTLKSGEAIRNIGGKSYVVKKKK